MSAQSKNSNTNETRLEEELSFQRLGQVIQVPTFQDNRATVSTSSNSCLSMRDDPFLYLSDPQRRLAHITGNERAHQDKANHQQHNIASTIKRKTRISFEVHHSILLGDLFTELGGMDEDEDNGSTSGLELPHLRSQNDDDEDDRRLRFLSLLQWLLVCTQTMKYVFDSIPWTPSIRMDLKPGWSQLPTKCVMICIEA